MINLPESIDKNLKDRIFTAYYDAVKEVMADGNEEKEYINKRLPKVLKTLKSRSNSWYLQIATYAEILHEYIMLSDDCQIDKIRPFIIASLFYLCNPFDIIPDYTPGTGYLDDAFVINTCLKEVKKCNFTLYEEIIFLSK